MSFEYSRSELKPNILFFLFILMQFVFMVIDIPFEMYFVAGMAAIILMLLAGRLTEVTNMVLLNFMLITVVLAYISHLYNGNINMFGLTNIVILFAGTLLLFNMKPEIIFAKTFFWIAVLYFVYVFIRYRDMHMTFTGISENYVSVVLILALMYLTVCADKTGERIRLEYYIVSFILCVIAIGRGGIVSSAFILVMEIVSRSLREENRTRKYLYKLLLLFVIALVLFVFSNPDLVYRVFSRFIDVGVLDEARERIWTEYYDMIKDNRLNAIFGPHVNDNEYLARFDMNMHNSIITMHSRYGLICVIMNVLMAGYSFVWFVREKKTEMCIAFATLFLRGMTDAVFGAYWGDIFWWYFLLYPIIAGIRSRMERRGEFYSKYGYTDNRTKGYIKSQIQ